MSFFCSVCINLIVIVSFSSWIFLSMVCTCSYCSTLGCETAAHWFFSRRCAHVRTARRWGVGQQFTGSIFQRVVRTFIQKCSYVLGWSCRPHENNVQRGSTNIYPKMFVRTRVESPAPWEQFPEGSTNIFPKMLVRTRVELPAPWEQFSEGSTNIYPKMLVRTRVEVPAH